MTEAMAAKWQLQQPNGINNNNINHNNEYNNSNNNGYSFNYII